MKGPGMRLDLDVRRCWRCAQCGTHRHTPGRVTVVRCHFCQDHPLMTLVEPQRRSREPVPPPDMIIALHPDDIEAPAFVPAHLRELEEEAAEPAAEVLEPVESPVESEQAAAPEAETVSSASAKAETVGNGSRSRRSRKQRPRKNRRKQSPPSSESPKSTESAPPKPDDSFGEGLDD